MGKEAGIKNLLMISEPKQYAKGDFICSEGEPGEEMYVVLKGAVSVYINSILDDKIHVADVKSGEFFGEMAIFEKKPRSASCIAAENTSCIAIRQENLRQLIETCPDIAEKLMMGLSVRVREMNDKLYKSPLKKENQAPVLPFEIPGDHEFSNIKDKSEAKYLTPMNVRCPACGKPIKVENMRINELETFKVTKSQRRIYKGFDSIWHFVRTCSECGYSNYYVDFFHLPDADREDMQKVISMQKNYLAIKGRIRNQFDQITARYYQAIHFNQCFNSHDRLLLGKLWLYLSWLYEDAENKVMADYCTGKALEYYEPVYNEEQDILTTEKSKQQCAMIIAELARKKKDGRMASLYYHEVIRYSNQELSQQAYDRIYEMREKK